MGSQLQAQNIRECPGKRAYPTRWDAEAVAARHYSCAACLDGLHMDTYECLADPSPPGLRHHHIGHRRADSKGGVVK